MGHYIRIDVTLLSCLCFSALAGQVLSMEFGFVASGAILVSYLASVVLTQFRALVAFSKCDFPSFLALCISCSWPFCWKIIEEAVSFPRTYTWSVRHSVVKEDHKDLNYPLLTIPNNQACLQYEHVDYGKSIIASSFKQTCQKNSMDSQFQK